MNVLGTADAPSHELRELVQPQLVRIRIYPIKSLDGADVATTTVTRGGALWRDREFALFDEQGEYVNAKRDAKIHALRVVYDRDLGTASFTSASLDDSCDFAFADAPARLERWLGFHFGRGVFLRRDVVAGFPDDVSAPGPTVVSTATLEAVAAWFPTLDVASIRARLRSNLELGATPAFWEDRLYTIAAGVVAFTVGDVELEGTNPCARCIVPSRDAMSGEPMEWFAKVVAERRAAMLPPWAEHTRFDHFYRLAVNTRISGSQAGRVIGVGAPVAIDAR